jgi:Ni,Fe-hydrogenase I cytochrome b subunit
MTWLQSVAVAGLILVTITMIVGGTFAYGVASQPDMLATRLIEFATLVLIVRATPGEKP